MAIKLTSGSQKTSYEGITYYLCSAAMAKSFQADSEKYALTKYYYGSRSKIRVD
jgi:YHS domain-containing protein